MSATGSPAALRSTRVDVRGDVRLEDIVAAQWNALAPEHPLLSHAFLSALHASGCASRSTGWQPRFVTAWRSDALVGAMPMYEKTHSYGEYVFDWGWAEAYRRHGRRYYPKLVVAVPFTPVSGPRLMADDDDVRRLLVEHALARLRHGEASSLHVLFVQDRDAAACRTAGLTPRFGVQFRWTNAGYRDFDDFLAAFAHDKRKKVRQDRRKVADAGVRFVRKVGREIASADWAFFCRCYEATYRAHHSTPYLTPAFFERIAEAMPDRLLLVLGERNGRRICAALDVFTSRTLWGRYWGAVDFVSGLHFEACYYQAIEFCIERGIETFEGGAQGLHKLARGLAPVTTHSAHAIADPGFAAAIDDYCARERLEIAHSVSELEQAMPYKARSGNGE
jgi:predicted N-acyltransferase